MEHRSRSRLIEKIADEEKQGVQILEELKLIEIEATTMRHWASVDGFKQHGYFRGGFKVKAFLSKEIRVMVLWGRGDSLIVMKAGYSLGVDDHGKSTMIHYVVMR